MSRRAFVTPENAPDSFECQALFVPVGQSWQAILTGALYALTLVESFEQVSGLTPEQTALVFAEMFSHWDKGDCPMFAGMITLAARTDTPSDAWLACDGEAYQITQYPDLYNAIGTAFGDDGAGTFRVPNLLDAFPVGAGGTYALADSGGEAEHTLTDDEMPQHQHQITYAFDGGTGGGLSLVTTGTNGSTSTGAAGNDQPHNNLPPFVALQFFIYTGG